MEENAYSLQLGEDFRRVHGGVERDWLPQFADTCVFNDRENKVMNFAFGGVKE